MRHTARLVILSLGLIGAAGLAAAPIGDGSIPTLRMAPGSGGDVTRATFEVVGLSAPELAALGQSAWSTADWNRLFSVSVEVGERPLAAEPRPPIAGRYEVAGDVLRFRPRFPLERGLRYRALYDPARLPRSGKPDSGVITAVFLVARADVAPVVVRRVDPVADELPENLLKFYVHFSGPMSRGSVYQYIQLRQANGPVVDLPFLEIGEELWNRAGTRLTLLIDPGRIKKGLRPREESGPVLISGKTYELTIDRRWPDANGNALGADYRKRFRAGSADETPPDPHNWRIAPPGAGTRRALVLRFPEPLDRSLLEHVITVRDARGAVVEGAVTVPDDARQWQLVPPQPWPPGRYRVVVQRRLEDLAGNQVGRPFEVDIVEPIPARRAEEESVEVPFVVQ